MRIYQLLRGLAQQHRVTCLSFAADQAAADALNVLSNIVDVQVVLGPAVRSTARRAITTIASMQPDMALRNQSQTYSAALSELLQKQRFDIVQAESIEMAPYLLDMMRSGILQSGAQLSRNPGNPRHGAQRSRVNSGDSSAYQKPLLVLDQFNVEYMLQKRAALTSLNNAITASMRPMARVRHGTGAVYSLAQWFKLKRYERQALRQLPAIVAVSNEDAQVFRQLYPQAGISIVPNGVDTTVFSRAALAQRLEPVLKRPSIVFSGTLDFRANIDAVLWLAEQVLPIVRQRYPELDCVVVGKRPAAALQELAQTGILQLTGEVSDARPYIAEAAVYVVPMRIGGGVRLKLLEALALEAALVSTSMGAEGIQGLRHNRHCLIADRPQDFAAAIIQVLEQPEQARRMGVAGRELMCEAYDWQHIVPKLEKLYTAALEG